MKTLLLSLVLASLPFVASAKKKVQPQLWPDGTPISEWFNDTSRVDISTLGKQYVITDFGVKNDSTLIQTSQIQAVIDQAARNGGGVIVVPKGTFLTGALFFKPGTHLHIQEGGTIKGSDRIANFPVATTRIEGETCKYFTALINADHVDGFTISGKGTLNGNGYHYWEEFWIRRKWNPKCTNKDAQRPRLVYISNSKNVTVQDVKIMNSPFWTNHIYNCDHVRYIGCHIYAPTTGAVKAPSSDALDIDKCHDVLVHGCWMNVNDDAIVLKGGKGTFADKDSTNGAVYNVIIQNCYYETVSGMLTLGSESLHDRNIILRNCTTGSAHRGVWFKMRNDTPQHYEYVRIEGIKGKVQRMIVVRPWSQFFNRQQRDDMPLSRVNNVTVSNCQVKCDNFFDVTPSDQYALNDFNFSNLTVEDKAGNFNPNLIENTSVKNVVINGVEVKDKK